MNDVFVNKKGQLTIFVIIGIVLVISFGFFLFMTKEFNSSMWETNTFKEGDFQFIERYIQQVAISNQDLIAIQGGYLNPPFPKTNYRGFNIPVYDSPITLDGAAEQMNNQILKLVSVYVNSTAPKNFYLEFFNDFQSETEFQGTKLVIKYTFTYKNTFQSDTIIIDTYLPEMVESANKVIISNIQTNSDASRLPSISILENVNIETIDYLNVKIYYLSRGDKFIAFAMER